MEIENIIREAEPLLTMEDMPVEANTPIAECGEAAAVLDEVGLNISDYEREYSECGGLSEESYSRLEKVGISKAVVDNYIAGQEAIVAARVAEVFSVAGGEASYSKMMEWASKNLNERERLAYNSVVNAGDINAVKLALYGIQARYKASSGYEPGRRLEGAGVLRGDSYGSMAEMVRDVQDTRYKSDEAYRAKVVAKAARSKF